MILEKWAQDSQFKEGRHAFNIGSIGQSKASIKCAALKRGQSGKEKILLTYILEVHA